MPDDKHILRQGMKVICKDDPKKKVGFILDNPPAVIGDPYKPRGIFPIKLPGLVYVKFPFKDHMHVCLERESNLVVVSNKKVEKHAGKRRVVRDKKTKKG